MFERYTESARRSLFFARDEASQLGAVSIETEHLLLGLVRDGSVLPLLTGILLERLRADLESHRLSAEATPTSVEIPFAGSAKRSLQFAAEEADRLLHDHIGCEHLLLGLLREERSVAASTLAAHGVRLSDVRRKVKELPGPLGAASPAAATRVGVVGQRLAIDRIKVLVEQLARAPRDSPEAKELVTRIHAELDALLNR
jgi:ATP-dependent Clp protease ATP-binding subunit ClpC